MQVRFWQWTLRLLSTYKKLLNCKGYKDFGNKKRQTKSKDNFQALTSKVNEVQARVIETMGNPIDLHKSSFKMIFKPLVVKKL